MKKVFLTMMMLLFAVTGVMRAQTLTVHDGSATNGYVPVYGFYADAYLKCEMVYPADELSVMAGGMINGMTFEATQSSVNWGTNFQVFLAEVESTTISAFAGPDAGTIVYEGALSIAGGEMVMTFDTPYSYGGGNLLVGVYQTSTGGYITSTWKGETVTGASVQGYNYNSLSSVSASQRNFLPKTTFEYVAGGAATVTTDPSPLDLGYRPNGAWMAPYVFDLINNGGAISVTGFSFNDNYFTANAELPAAVYGGNPLSVEVTTGEATPGTVSTEMLVVFDGGRNFETFDITATAYDPVEGDVWENAIELSLEPQVPTEVQQPEMLYKNYALPDGSINSEAVYKLTFDDDVLLYAAANDANASTFLYTEDFEEVGGPAADNNYEYNGPHLNPGPVDMWFSYPATGSYTNLGYSTAGDLYYGYMIPAEYLQQYNLGNCAITSVESAINDYSGTYCDLFILKGGDTPDINNLVYYQEFYDFEFGYYFDITLDEPQFLGDDENIWIMFATDNTRLLAQNGLTDPNGMVWYSRSATTWYNDATRTPVVYTHFLELPTGREITLNSSNLNHREFLASEAGQISEVEGTVSGISKAQMHGTRTLETLIEEGWENGIGNWTMSNCHNSTGVSTAYTANSGSSVFRFYYSSNYPQYLISPELEDNNGGTISFYYARYSSNYPETFKVGYSTTTNDPSAFTFGSEVTATNLYTNEYVEYSYDFPAGTKYVCIACTSNDQFYLFIDDVVVTADINSGTPTPTPTPTPTAWTCPFDCTGQIDGMYVPAGTYYLVVASPTVRDMVNVAIDNAPVPEPSYVSSPYNGEANVEAPYVARWVLGDYTTEMQVLVGTQYPPTTVLIDWTDYLVPSAVLTNLENNKNYFIQVNGRNSAGTTMGEVTGFTTPIDPVAGFDGAESYLYPEDAAEFTWEPNTRTLMGYNLYYYNNNTGETVLVNDEGPITGTEYSVEGLEYNNEAMGGYDFYVKALYGAGESSPSDIFVVYMTGTTTISGTVYDQDSITVIPNAEIEFRGVDEYGNDQVITATADENGEYTCEVLVGQFTPYVVSAAYDPEVAAAAEVTVVYNDPQEVNLYTHEFYFPLGMITATEQVDDNNVLVEWDWNPAAMIVDFETGDFSQAEFTLPAQYPWVVTTTNPYEGTYCMKSSCEGIASASSIIEATVEVPFDDAKMGFYVRVSSESNYDKFHFYIDGVEQGAALSGNTPYAYKEYAVTSGTHTYKWEYTKDSSVNSNDDCIYVDNITMFRQDVPLPPVQGATTYNFDDQTMMGWTSVDGDGDGNGWVSSSNPGIYHNSGVSLSGTGHNSSEAYVISGSYANQTGQALTPNNFLVSPTQISASNGAQIQFWACAQDASYAAEHFGVAVSTTTATAGAFTTIQEWTMTAKGAQGSTAENERDIRGTRQGSWYMYTADLSAYAGQDIWVAIRHFNCTDMFILNVDDITLADGSAKPMARDERSFQGFNLYRRDIKDGENDGELIATPAADVFEYIDNDWSTLDYGMWQWGIQATYEGNAPTEGNRDQATYTFEGGSLDGWTVIKVNADGGEWIHSNNNLGGYDYTELAHGGTGFAMCYSYVDYDGPYDTDCYFVSPQKYGIGSGSSISFWADNANDSYPEDFSVCVSTAATPTASSFTQIWSGGAKGDAVSDKAEVRHQNNRYENWRSHNIDLSAYAGQEVWIAFHDVNYDMYEIWIDDVTVNYAGGTTPTPTPTPTPTGSGLSEILWSNVIEKDMTCDLTVNVALNNNQDPTGAAVSFVGPETYNATIDATGTVTFANFRKGEYELTVTLDGYADHVETLMIEENEPDAINVILYEIIAPVEDLYVSPTGWAMWTGGTVGGTTPVGPVTPVGPGGEVSYDFDDGTMMGWTTIDANNDGYDWVLGSQIGGVYLVSGASLAGSGHNSSADLVCSGSYSNASGAAITPNNYLVSPTKGNYTGISFYACGQDASYVAEHFGVAVATTSGAPAASDFTIVSEWTMTAKGSDVMSIGRDGETRAQGSWHEFTADLSAYAGQEIWVAIRHFNCSDMFILDVDDITLTAAGKGDRTALMYKVKLDGVFEGETPYPYFQHNVEGFEEGSEHVTSVAALYATGMGDWVDYTWTYVPCDNYDGVDDYAATVDGNNVTLTWTLNATPGPGPGPTPPPTGTTTYDFDDGTMMGWTTIDANNDGYDWVLGSQIGGVYLVSGASLAGSGHNSSADLVCSGSYSNATGSAITPNNYLVSPSKGAYTSVSFFACGQDASYVAEHFGVAVATTSGTPAASDFTIVSEWTMTAKGSGVMSIGRDGETRAQGSWHEYTADLSAYAGQEIWVAIRHFNCSDMFILDVDDITLNGSTKGNRDMWDIVYEFDATSGYQYGVATDGTNIYTSSWSASSSSMFYKYDMQGNFIEEFNISGCGQLRGMAYDGEYFYGVANSSTVYCVDLANHSLVSSFTTSYGAMRCITYDPERDGFWVVGNWSGNLTLIDRTGAIVQAGPAPTSASDVAYYKDPAGVEHIYYIKNESGNGELYEYNITTGTMGSSPLINCASNSNWTGSSGGCFVGTYDNKTCFFADAQQTPQHIVIYELDSSSTPGPGPIVPTPGDLLGVYVFRDGELISGQTALTATTYTDSNAPAGEHDYCVRVVYSDYAMSCPVCETVEIGEVSCDPVTNLTGEYMVDPTYGPGILLEWEGNANGYEVFYNGTQSLGTTTDNSIFIYGIPGDGNYLFGIVAIYDDCESDMETVTVYYDAIGENEIVNNIYPNPTNDKVTIEAQGMNHITVANALGQVVYDADVDADQIELNLGQYNAGLYLIRVSTVNGVSVKRVSVVK